MTLADTPSHWAQIDPGPGTTRSRRAQRIDRLKTERDTELERLQAWRDSIDAELHRTSAFFDALIAREQRAMKGPGL